MIQSGYADEDTELPDDSSAGLAFRTTFLYGYWPRERSTGAPLQGAAGHYHPPSGVRHHHHRSKPSPA